MKKQEIEKYFEQFNHVRTLVIGDIMLDSYIWGKVSRISPEAPVPVVDVVKREYRPGGAANVALNLRSLGSQVFLCALTGQDANGNTLTHLLEENNIHTSGIITDKQRPTTVKHRIISNGQHLLRIDEEETSQVNEQTALLAFEKIRQIVEKQNIDLIIFQDYDKGFITPELITHTVDYANRKGVFVSVDPKRNNFLNYKNVSLFKPNRKELFEGLNLPVSNSVKEAYKAVEKLQKRIDARCVMTTLSEDGVIIASNEESLHLPAAKRQIADVSGAGDTVISIASLMMVLGASLQETAFLANLGGGIVCEYPGVVAIDKEKLLEEAQKTA